MGLSVDRRTKPGRDSGKWSISPTLNPGLRLLVPGLAQWSWNQRERGSVFLFSFLASLIASAMCWGNLLGWAFLGLAFLTQVAALVDVIRQRAFPVFHRGIAVVSIGLGIGLTFYLPLTEALCTYAFPATPSTADGAGYLVNCRAYQKTEPVPGHWIWLRDDSHTGGLAGQVIAVAGQEVEWTGRRWRIDGKDLVLTHPGTLPQFPASWRFQVPPDHVLIDQEPALASIDPQAPPLAIVSRDQIVGRAWARYYPFWDRCLL